MKSLTLKAPWGWAIIHAGKDIENRTWATRHRGTIWVHTGQGEDSSAFEAPAIKEALLRAPERTQGHWFLRGFVLGEVDVVDVHHAEECRKPDGSLCSPWAENDQYHWRLKNPRAFACPFPEVGKQGLWEAPVNR
ncbi:hypothetical protein [Arthrobacter sp. NPDC090010]|uniref:hypothetical protein n=1 Tax=Arthrobacter sp. NPDC090010 TaxID=3363942 RepID=UPI00381D5B79